MILSKAKENGLRLQSGSRDITLTFTDALSCGNYWVDWAENFMSVCQDVLGLEIEKGPGTSVGIIYYNGSAKTGAGLNQYDCDWTQPNGKTPDHNYYGDGISLWKDIDLWDSTNNSSDNGLNDETDISLLNIGIDKKNKRFDFIVWFTTDETINNQPKERIGLRFRYPLTTQRVFGTGFAISETPVILPWKKNNQDFNNDYKNKYWDTVNNNTDYIYFSQDDANKIISFNNFKYITNANLIHFVPTTKNFYNEQQYNWIHYSEFPDNTEQENYSALGGTFSSRQNNTPVAYFRAINFNKVKIIVSKNKRIINLAIFDTNNKTCAFNIVYGDLVNNSDNDESFIMLSTTNFSNYMSDMIITENSYTMHPPKQVNRPSVINTELPSYCAISRVLLQNQTSYCSELYQIFNFNDLMKDNYLYNKVFVDKEGQEHQFIVFNFGDKSNSNNNIIDYSQSIAFAVPI